MKLINTDIFKLPGNPHMLHIATIQDGMREFVAMLDVRTQQLYIEEVVLNSIDFKNDVWANFKFIDDDNLAHELATFCQDRKIIDMKRIQEVVYDKKLISASKRFPR